MEMQIGGETLPPIGHSKIFFTPPYKVPKLVGPGRFERPTTRSPSQAYEPRPVQDRRALWPGWATGPIILGPLRFNPWANERFGL